MTKSFGRWLIVVACAGLVSMAPSRAFAQLSAVSNSATGSTCTGANNSDGFCGNALTFPVANTGTTFTSRYAWNINADVGIFGTRDTSGNAAHNVSFSATAPGSYRVTINTNWAGDMNRINDLIGCNGQANISGVTGSTNIALNSGSLSLGDPGAIGNGSGTTSTPFATSTSGIINRLSNGVAQAHALTFTWNGSVRSNSCEAAVRLGNGHGTVTGCNACAYPGSPARTQANDGHFVQVNYVSFCGNGILDGIGEACDQGSANGTFTSCCATNCTFKSSSTACRSVAGPCDVAENCTGASATCPADGFASTSTICRGGADVCDSPENCTGSSPGCPFDFKFGGSTTCRGSAGVCDVVEVCDGVNNACPADQFASTSTVCRGSAGICDVVENCTGSGAACPGDGFVSSSTTCRGSAGVCDIAENCTGSSAACPGNSFEPTTTVCRGASDVCDVDETCTGSGAACPADAVEVAGVVCRPNAGVCDQDEECNGVDKACPIDSVSGAFVTCRPSAGICDVDEDCDGVGVNCPADVFVASTTVCRAVAGVCDIAENCTGGAAACPVDSFEPNTTVCRPDAGQCDVADNCPGTGAACTADAFEPSGTPCTDNDFCTAGDTCDGAGVCDSGINVNTTCAPCEACNPVDGSCVAGPRTDCLEPTVAAKARVLIKDRTPDRADLTVWKWIKGEATTLADFGDPTTTDAYTLCVFDDGTEVFRSDIPAGGTCGTFPCWRTLGSSGFKYINRDRTPDGILKVLLKSGAAGKAKVILKGKGDNLPYPGTPFLPMMTPVKIQLQNDTPGTCWQTTHMSVGPLINALDQFKAVSEGPTP
jgi:hypothetical protein